MRGRSRQVQPIGIESDNNNQKGITFNYSENFNRVIELDTDNYSSWRRKILYFLTINKLSKYVTTPVVRKLRKKDIKEDIENYIEDQFDDMLVYEKNTDPDDITNDITTKWIIINGLGEKTQKIIEGNEKTAYEIWKLLQESFTKSIGRRKMELNEKIKLMKFDINTDINIFLANLQNLFDELEKIDNDIPQNTKIGILNRSLPENLRFINVFQYSNWKNCCQYVKKVIPEILL